MKIRCRVRTWTSLATCLGLSVIGGCGGSSTPEASSTTTTSSSSSSSSSSASPGVADATAPSPDLGGSSPMSGMAGPGDPSVNSGGGDAGMGPTMLTPPGGPSSGMGDGMSNMSMGGGPGMSNMSMGGGPGMADMSMSGGGMSGPGMPGMMGMGMGGNGLTPPVDPAPAEDDTYLAKARYAFATGKESVADQYVIAEMLANDTEAAGLLQQVRFSTALRKPALTLRFAVGVHLEAPSSITDYKPIGRTQFANMNGQGGSGGDSLGSGMGMMGMPGGGGGQTSGGQKNLGDLTGRFGEEFIKSFEGAWDSGNFGSVFADVEAIAPRIGLNNGTNNGSGMGMGMPGMMGMSGGADMPMMGSGMGAPAGAAPTGDQALRLKATPGKSVVPGLTYLGTGKETELLGKAEAEGIDFLFLFEVEVKAQRQRINNDTKLKLMSVKEKKSLGMTTTLSNNKVDMEMATKGDNDEVAKQLGNLFKKVDTIKLQDMPTLKPETAQVRVKSLIEKKTKDVLPILMEIKLYHSQGVLNDEERDAAYQLTLPNGLAFATGSPEDRAFVLEPLLPGYK